MEILARLRSALAEWAEHAFHREGEQRPERPAGDNDTEPGDLERKSIRDVTLEQLGIAHWSCHTHF